MSNYYVFKEGKWFKNGEEISPERVKDEIPAYIRQEKEKRKEETYERDNEIIS